MAAKFDLSKYETVKVRKKKFYAENKDGRIDVNIKNDDILAHVLVKAFLYKNAEDQEKGLSFATGHAHETRDTELSKTQYGKEYASVNYTSWIENCEESAIGRALDNAGFSGNDKCSREEMIKVYEAKTLKEPVKSAIERMKTHIPIDKWDAFVTVVQDQFDDKQMELKDIFEEFGVEIWDNISKNKKISNDLLEIYLQD